MDEPVPETLSHREVRNESGKALRAVARGESFILTNRGAPIGMIVPLDSYHPGLQISRPAKHVGGWKALGITRKRTSRSLTDTMDDLRQDRA